MGYGCSCPVDGGIVCSISNYYIAQKTETNTCISCTGIRTNREIHECFLFSFLFSGLHFKYIHLNYIMVNSLLANHFVNYGGGGRWTKLNFKCIHIQSKIHSHYTNCILAIYPYNIWNKSDISGILMLPINMRGNFVNV